jgi:cytochrome c biogenesis protein CcmG/thiol:disulfide interchange protein DsbE
MRRWTFLLPSVVFAILIGFFIWRLVLMGRGDMPSDIETVLIDKPAPAFALPPLFPDKPGAVSQDLTGRVTLVNFFASWCIPCRVEHPLLAQVASKVELVGIAYKNSPEEARAWLANLGNPYQAIGIDEQGRVGIDFGVYGVPESYLIDRQGRIRYAWKKPFTPEEIKGTLLPLIAELNR